jgi:hypothetical protein
MGTRAGIGSPLLSTTAELLQQNQAQGPLCHGAFYDKTKLSTLMLYYLSHTITKYTVTPLAPRTMPHHSKCLMMFVEWLKQGANKYRMEPKNSTRRPSEAAQRQEDESQPYYCISSASSLLHGQKADASMSEWHSWFIEVPGTHYCKSCQISRLVEMRKFPQLLQLEISH